MKAAMRSSRVTGRTRTEAPDAQATAQAPSGNQTPSLNSVAEVEPSELFAFKECQDLFRKQLTEPMIKLVAQLTGLCLHVLWHGPMDFQEPGAMPCLCPRARQRVGAKGQQLKCCESCLQHRWKPALSPANQGRRPGCKQSLFCAVFSRRSLGSLRLMLFVFDRKELKECRATDAEFWSVVDRR